MQKRRQTHEPRQGAVQDHFNVSNKMTEMNDNSTDNGSVNNKSYGKVSAGVGLTHFKQQQQQHTEAKVPVDLQTIQIVQPTMEH